MKDILESLPVLFSVKKKQEIIKLSTICNF